MTVGIQIIESQTSFNVESGELSGKKIRPDGVTKIDKVTIALEFKAGKSARLRSDQKKKLGQFANVVLQFGCK